MAVRRRRVVVIGAGAAGSMAAIFAASGDVETLLLERTPERSGSAAAHSAVRCNRLLGLRPKTETQISILDLPVSFKRLSTRHRPLYVWEDQL